MSLEEDVYYGNLTKEELIAEITLLREDIRNLSIKNKELRTELSIAKKDLYESRLRIFFE